MTVDGSGSATAIAAAQQAAIGARICITSASTTIGNNFFSRRGILAHPPRRLAPCGVGVEPPEYTYGTMRLAITRNGRSLQAQLYKLKGHSKMASRAQNGATRDADVTG